MSSILFSTIEVTRQVFYRASLSYAIVNLMPIVPGHVLVAPNRPVPRIADLSQSELASLMSTVQHVSSVVQKVYHADGCTIACQDGKAAGQTIPHVHFHILPRKFIGDRFAGRNDDIYPELERAEGALSQPVKMDAGDDRPPRTMEEMEKEALWLKGVFDAQSEQA